MGHSLISMWLLLVFNESTIGTWSHFYVISTAFE